MEIRICPSEGSVVVDWVGDWVGSSIFAFDGEDFVILLEVYMEEEVVVVGY